MLLYLKLIELLAINLALYTKVLMMSLPVTGLKRNLVEIKIDK